MAVTVNLTWWQFEDAARCATRRVVESWRQNMQPRGRSARLTMDQLVATHLVGAAGELAASLVLGVPWPAHVNVGHDVPDLPPDWDVRATARPNGDLCVPPRQPVDRRVVLVYTDAFPRLVVVGWLWARDAMRAEYLRDHERMPEPLYITPRRLLHPVG